MSMTNALSKALTSIQAQKAQAITQRETVKNSVELLDELDIVIGIYEDDEKKLTAEIEKKQKAAEAEAKKAEAEKEKAEKEKEKAEKAEKDKAGKDPAKTDDK